jgi:hypothetical protein
VLVQEDATGALKAIRMTNGVNSGEIAIDPSNPALWKAVALGDVNGDGFADVIVQHTNNGNIAYANMANGQLSGYVVVANIGSTA